MTAFASAARVIALVLGAAALYACGATLPEDVQDYATRCRKMNKQLIPTKNDDPHRGTKNVYACNVDLDAVDAIVPRRFPEGTLMVKVSTREGEGYPWLIATARKQGQGWRWDEYTRNFEDDDFRRIVAGQQICTDCHRQAEAVDWIFTSYDGP